MTTNRRNFIASLFAILPAATQYKRVWKTLQSGVAVPRVVYVGSIGFTPYDGNPPYTVEDLRATGLLMPENQPMAIINPAWLTAEYDIDFFIPPEHFSKNPWTA